MAQLVLPAQKSFKNETLSSSVLEIVRIPSDQGGLMGATSAWMPGIEMVLNEIR